MWSRYSNNRAIWPSLFLLSAATPTFEIDPTRLFAVSHCLHDRQHCLAGLWRQRHSQISHPLLFIFTTLAFLATLACATVTRFFDTPTVDVFANKGWQETGVSIVQGQQVIIEVVSGRWFEDPPGVWHDAGGNPKPWRCGLPSCHEPLPDFPKYALIGRIGDAVEILQIGLRLEFVAANSGRLYLRPNYGDVDIPIFQPEGSVRVKIILYSPAEK